MKGTRHSEEQIIAILKQGEAGLGSLFNIARVFGGRLPKEGASLIAEETAEIASSAIVLTLLTAHRPRRRATVGSQQFVALGGNKTEGIGALLGPKAG